jgi:hypothetical protein
MDMISKNRSSLMSRTRSFNLIKLLNLQVKKKTPGVLWEQWCALVALFSGGPQPADVCFEQLRYQILSQLDYLAVGDLRMSRNGQAQVEITSFEYACKASNFQLSKFNLQIEMATTWAVDVCLEQAKYLIGSNVT